MDKYGAEILQALGGGGGLPGRRAAVSGHPEAAGRRLPALPQHRPLHAGQPLRLRPREPLADAGRRGRNWTAWPCPGWPSCWPGSNGPTRITNSTRPSTACTSFAPWRLSSIYLDILKDRLYVSKADSRERRSAQSTLYDLLQGLTLAMAPILSFTADEIWEYLPGTGRPESVHLGGSSRAAPGVSRRGLAGQVRLPAQGAG